MSISYYQIRSAIAITGVILSCPFQSAGQYATAVKAHTFRATSGLFSIGLEQAFNKHVSAELSLQGGYYINIHPNRLEDFKVTGIGGVGALRYYPFTKKAIAPQRFFAYAALRYVDFKEAFLYTASGDRYEVGGNIVNAGAGIGYKFVYRRLGLEAFIGWGVGRLNSDDDEYRNNIPKYYQSTITEEEHFPQLDVAVCYMFNLFK